MWGWSGGGTNTLNAMFRFPDVYKVGVSVAPVPDQKLYDTIYQERYMGVPQENEAGYKVGSAINFAEGLQGKLLVVHGSGDDNVHAQGTERLINRLIELGKPFDSMIYPNRTHSISEGTGDDAARLQADRALLLHEPDAGTAVACLLRQPRLGGPHFILGEGRFEHLEPFEERRDILQREAELTAAAPCRDAAGCSRHRCSS